jgi:ribonuclease PH
VEEVWNKILNKLDKLDKIELDISVIKNDVKLLNKKVDGITIALATAMEDITELKDKVEKQNVEICVIKGGAANG